MKLFNEHEKYVIPYYNTDIIVDESFLPLRKKDDSDLIVISMMNKIKRVNINHPSDFLARLYAQGILTLFGQ